VIIKNNKFENNTDADATKGGAIGIPSQCQIPMSGNIFTNNSPRNCTFQTYYSGGGNTNFEPGTIVNEGNNQSSDNSCGF
jgi:hypothetical protein